MQAMIFAAGYGSRLRPLTDTIPKALVAVEGVPMLERVAMRLAAAGATRIVINAHHFADQIHRFVQEKNGFGVETIVSDESEELLDTGGGLLRAFPLFRPDEPILLHNVDVYTDLDLRWFYDAFRPDQALALLATNKRSSSRYLLFDTVGLVGFGNAATGFERRARAVTGELEQHPFCGLHLIDPGMRDMITEEGIFSIIPLYMRLVGEGRVIAPQSIDPALWIDIGRPEQLERARAHAQAI